MGTGNYITDNIAFKYSTVWHKKKTRQRGFKRFFVGDFAGKGTGLKYMKETLSRVGFLVVTLILTSQI